MSINRRNFIRSSTFLASASLLPIEVLSLSLANNANILLGVALVGLGRYASGELGPALLQTRLAQLKGIVTGSPEKIPGWVEKYKIPERNVYNYDNFDEIAGNDDIDIIYIVLPNFMHAEYTIRASKAGKVIRHWF